MKMKPLIKGPKPEEKPIRCKWEKCGKIITDVNPDAKRKKRFCNMKCYKAWWDHENKEHKSEYDRGYNERKKKKAGVQS